MLKLLIESEDTDGILKRKLAKVDTSDLTETLAELREMVAVMNENGGIGLASNQVNLDKSMFVFFMDGKVEFVINPQIIKQSQQKSSMVEGCLSYPNKEVAVIRPKEIMVRYHNGTKVVVKTLNGMNCRIWLHEFNHTQGQCIVGK